MDIIKFASTYKYQFLNGKVCKVYNTGSLQDLSAFAVTICIYKHFNHPGETRGGEFLSIDRSQKATVDHFKKDFMASLPTLSLPSSLEEKIKLLRGPLGYELARWRGRHTRIINLLPHLINFSPNELIWNAKGVVDWKRTAEIFVNDERLPEQQRLHLACVYFLETDVNKLWSFFEEYSKEEMREDRCCDHFFVYWYDIFKKKETADDYFEYKFRHAVHFGNVAATDYFLYKLKPEKVLRTVNSMGGVVLGSLSCSLIADISYYYTLFQLDKRFFFDHFSLMFNVLEKLKVCIHYYDAALLCHTFWPYDAEFISLASFMFKVSCLPEHEFASMLKILIELDDLFFTKNFENFWLISPKKFRDYFNFMEQTYLLKQVIGIFMEEEKRWKNFFKSLLEFDKDNIAKGDFVILKILLFISRNVSGGDLLAELEMFVKKVDAYLVDKGGDDYIYFKIMKDKFKENLDLDKVCKEVIEEINEYELVKSVSNINL